MSDYRKGLLHGLFIILFFSLLLDNYRLYKEQASQAQQPEGK